MSSKISILPEDQKFWEQAAEIAAMDVTSRSRLIMKLLRKEIAARSCSNCDALLRRGAKFCDQCGKPVSGKIQKVS